MIAEGGFVHVVFALIKRTAIGATFPASAQPFLRPDDGGFSDSITAIFSTALSSTVCKPISSDGIFTYKWLGFENPPDLRTNNPSSSNSFNAVFTEDFADLNRQFLYWKYQINISILIYPAILSRYPCPVIQNHIKEFCSLRNSQFEQKLRKLEVLKHLLWLLHVFIFHSFLALFLFLTVVKIIYMPAQKMSLHIFKRWRA